MRRWFWNRGENRSPASGLWGRARRFCGGAGLRAWVSALILVQVGVTVVLAYRLNLLAPPNFEQVRRSYRTSDRVLVDREGRILQELRVDLEARRLDWVRLSDVSPALLSAVLAAEDRRYLEHPGVDWKALASSTWSRLAIGRDRGASTITMQVAGLLDTRLQPEGSRRSLRQKLDQILAALMLERTWSKEEILEAYLNLVSFRGELVGVGTASRGLFNKYPHGLTESEALVLAALIRSPSAGVALVASRAEGLADAMGLQLPKGEPAATAGRLDQGYAIRGRADWAPHAARRILGTASGETEGALQSTLDFGLQRFVLEAVQRELLALRHKRVRDAAALVVDHQNADVLAYVGSGGAVSSAAHVDGVRAPRQAGSTLKPLLYALALERGLITPASLIDDSPMNLRVVGGLYRPDNYDHRFRGAVTVRTALASSLNVPAVRVLELVGVENFLARLEQLGFESLRSPEFYGPSLALGSADVTLWDLVSAYAVLGRQGRSIQLSLSRNESGTTAESEILSPQAVFLVSSILSDREARSETFALESPLATPFWTAVKTGTSKDMRDNWCVGYSSRYVVGVWVGNFAGEPMWNVSGVSGAAPLWLTVMSRLHDGVPSQPPAAPPGVVTAPVLFEEVGGTRQEWFLEGTEITRVRRLKERAAERIVYPPDGTIVAVDPDIPAGSQRIFFEASAASSELRWELDGEVIGASDRPVAWQPAAGKHELKLLGKTGEALDAVVFYVRGPDTAPPGP